MKGWLKGRPSLLADRRASLSKPSTVAPTVPQRAEEEPTDLLLCRLLDGASVGLEHVDLILDSASRSNEHLVSQLAGKLFALLFHRNYAEWRATGCPQTGTGRLQSRRALLVLLQVLPLLPLELAIFYLVSLNALLRPSAANTEFAADVRLAERLLSWLSKLLIYEGPGKSGEQYEEGGADVDGAEDELIGALIELIQCVGTHRLHAGEVRALLGLVRRLTPASMPRPLCYRLRLVESLSMMMMAAPPLRGPSATTSRSVGPAGLSDTFIQLGERPPTGGAEVAAADGAAIRLRSGALGAGKVGCSVALWLMLPHGAPADDERRALIHLRLPTDSADADTHVALALTARSAVPSGHSTGASPHELAFELHVEGERGAEQGGGPSAPRLLGCAALPAREWHLLILSLSRGRFGDDEAVLHCGARTVGQAVPLRLPAGARKAAPPHCVIGAPPKRTAWWDSGVSQVVDAFAEAHLRGAESAAAHTLHSLSFAPLCACVRSAYLFSGALSSSDAAGLASAGAHPAFAWFPLHAVDPDEALEAALPAVRPALRTLRTLRTPPVCSATQVGLPWPLRTHPFRGSSDTRPLRV